MQNNSPNYLKTRKRIRNLTANRTALLTAFRSCEMISRVC